MEIEGTSDKRDEDVPSSPLPFSAQQARKLVASKRRAAAERARARKSSRRKLLVKGRSRPRKDGSGSFVEVEVSSGTSSEEKGTAAPQPLAPPDLTGAQRDRAKLEAQKLEGRPTEGLVKTAESYLSIVEEARGASRNLQGGVSEKIKFSTYLALPAVRELGIRATEQGDLGFLRRRVSELEVENGTFRSKIVHLEARLSR